MSIKNSNYTTALDKNKGNQPSMNPYYKEILSILKENGVNLTKVKYLLQEAFTYERATAHLKYANVYTLRAHAEKAGVSYETIRSWKEKYLRGGENT